MKRSKLLVLVQFTTLFLLAITASWPDINFWSLGLMLLSVILAEWAVLAMRKSALRVMPEVAEKAHLVTSGPYRWIRHPMYTADIGLGLGLVLISITPIRVLIWGILVADLIFKLRYEELLLRERFADYAEYRKRTFRLIPLVY